MILNLFRFSRFARPLKLTLSRLWHSILISGRSIVLLPLMWAYLGVLALRGDPPVLQLVLFLLAVAGLVVIGRLLYSAFYDELTGLPNRASFIKRIEREMRRSRHHSNPFAIFFLDLNRFKSINEKLGQANGDRLLIEIKNRLKASIHASGAIARVGGNEFALLQRGIHEPMQAIEAASRIQAIINRPIALRGQDICLTASIGIALDPAHYTWADDLFKDAQIAMYHAKSLGRARHAIFHADLRGQAVTLLPLEADLWRAVEQKELRLHYQPLVCLKSGKIAGFEALVRWHHPKHGLISPAEFIPVAEDSGLIISIGYWALHHACQQTKIWQHMFSFESPMMISVNLSSKQFSQPDLVQQVKQVLAETGLDAHTLKLEITESMLMENIEAAIATLQQIRALNVRIGIDDFGTGYSSLSQLHRFPSDTLKIDQSFISHLDDDEETSEIVRTIITMAHNLGMTVIAEGIETTKQLDQLRALNCEYGQGFLFSEPLTQDAAEMLLAQSPRW